LIFSSGTRSEESVGDIVTVQNYGASGAITYRPNSKFSVVGSASFSREDPQSSLYTEKDRFGGGISLQVPISETSRVEGGISYEKTESETAVADNEIYTYFVGLSGNLLPKVSGNISVGIQQQKLDSGGDETSPYLSAGLDWLVSERTKVTLDASQNFGTTIDDRTSETQSVSLTASHQLRRDWSVNAFVGYIKDDYSGAAPVDNRTDEEYFIGVGTSYQLVEWESLGFDVRYSDQTSSQATFEYDRLRAGLSFNAQW
jgi:outer membrane protein assembly factor BamA